MKGFRKWLSIMLAAVMVFAMTIPAAAAPGGHVYPDDQFRYQRAHLPGLPGIQGRLFGGDCRRRHTEDPGKY